MSDSPSSRSGAGPTKQSSSHPAAPNPKHSASGRFATQASNLTVAELLLEYLKLEGATKLFGIPGGALIFIINELKLQKDNFDFYICRQETGAAYIAHGYSRVTGDLGVVMTTAGPAATNALTGVMNAEASSCSVLHISGEVPQKYFGEGYLQEGIDAHLDIEAIYRNAVKYSTVISNQSNFATLFEAALRAARSQPPRAAHVSVPNDVAGTCVTGDDKAHPYNITLPTSPSNYRAVPCSTDREAVKSTLNELVNAKKPLIFLGNGARQALMNDPTRLERFKALSLRFALPVMTSPDAKGIFPETHAMSLRNYGMTACSWPDLYMKPPTDPDHFDALLVIGSGLGELATTVVAKDHYSKNLIPTEHFIQVDLNEAIIGRDFPISRGIVGDAGATIDALCEFADQLVPEQTALINRRTLIADIKDKNSPFADPTGRGSTASPLHPASLVRVMNDVIDDGHVFIDAGNCVGWSLNNFVVDPPLQMHTSLNMGPMGFAVGAVVGGKIGLAKLNTPSKPCVALVGDGAFMMQGSEISTAAQYRVGAIWIVLYDNDLAMVSQGMAELFPPANEWDDYYKLGAPDLVKYAEGLGAEAVAIEKHQGPAEFEAALKQALRQAEQTQRPQVIVAHIDTKPMPPYGWPKVPEPPSKSAPKPGDDGDVLDYAIVGGGVSGIYSAWRLQTTQTSATAPNIALFESSPRLGGRLLSVIPPNIPSGRVELGGMRYIHNEQPWVTSLVDHLGLTTEELEAGQPQNFTYIRGRHLRTFELTDAEKLPYDLNKYDESKEQLGNLTALAAMRSLQDTIYRLLGKNIRNWKELGTIMTPEDWRVVAEQGTFEDTPLYQLPMHYLMLRTIGNEAYNLAQDSSGYDSILHTWNAADGFPWNVGDYGPEVKYLHVKDGYEHVPLDLAQRFKNCGGKIHLQHRLKSFDYDNVNKVVTMEIETGGQTRSVRAKNLILAMPRCSIELLDQTGAVLDPSNEDVHALIESVTPIPLFKLAICYRYPWWEDIPGIDTGDGTLRQIKTGKSVTDLPIRQCYYWKVDPTTKHAVILIYDDGTALDYWAGLRDSTQPPYPHDPQTVGDEFNLGDWANYPAPRRMVEEVHRQLVELHGVDPDSVPQPYSAAYRDWGEEPFGGGAFFWHTGVKSYEVGSKIIQPKPPYPVYICGDAYSHAQGWVEGALNTAEQMLQGPLGLQPPSWKQAPPTEKKTK